MATGVPGVPWVADPIKKTTSSPRIRFFEGFLLPGGCAARTPHPEGGSAQPQERQRDSTGLRCEDTPPRGWVSAAPYTKTYRQFSSIFLRRARMFGCHDCEHTQPNRKKPAEQKWLRTTPRLVRFIVLYCDDWCDLLIIPQALRAWVV